MGDRLDLHERFVEMLDMTEPDGDSHVYFNPPSSVYMKYPAIRYSLNRIDTLFASGGSYRRAPSYEVILIDEDPDTIYLTKILDMPYCKFDRFYRANNLNHWVFTIYNL
jgi:hypothetical protein